MRTVTVLVMFYATASFVVCYLLILLTHRGRKQSEKFTIRYLAIAVFAAYLAGLFSVTIMPNWMIYSGTDGKLHFQITLFSMRNLNLIPFQTIKGYLTGRTSADSIREFTQLSIMNLLGNVVLFFPAGILIPIVFPRVNRIYQVLAAGAILSLFIEIMQYIVERSSDVDDLILNTCGTLVGYFAFYILKSVKRKFTGGRSD